MGDINRALGAAGAPSRMVCGGRTYLLSPLTKGVQGELEEWLYGRATAAVSPSLEDGPYAATMAALAERKAAGAYDFTGKLMGRALRTPDGMAELLRLLLKKHQADVTSEDVFALIRDHGREVVAAVNAMTAALRGNAPAPGEAEATPAVTATA